MVHLAESTENQGKILQNKEGKGEHRCTEKEGKEKRTLKKGKCIQDLLNFYDHKKTLLKTSFFFFIRIRKR